ncbi:MAG TPA: tetratricopeptide repeat protein [Opitutaceae bacterium]
MSARLALAMAAALALAGCRAREITKLERDEAANDVSDADFAVTIHDWGRAETGYGSAAALCPDEGDIWMNLGIVRMRQHKGSDAKAAYKSALSAYEDSYKAHPSNSVTVLRRAYALVVLGRGDEARSVVADAAARAPDDRRLQSFIETKGLDKMMADPGLKEISP